jgi:hypothetical protein
MGQDGPVAAQDAVVFVIGVVGGAYWGILGAAGVNAALEA